MDPRIEREYRRQRAKGWPAHVAIHQARTIVQWRDADDLVELHVVPDEDMYDDSYLDTWGLSEKKLASERKALWERIDRDGVWIVVGRYRLSEDDPWIAVDNCGGFIGDDWKDSGYDTDIMASTLKALAEAQLQDRAEHYEVTEPIAEGWS